MAILGSEITKIEVNDDITKLHFTVHVTKNVKVVRIYYDRWQDGWESINYTSWLEIPRHHRNQAIYSVGVSEILEISSSIEKIRASVIASNMALKEGFGSSVRKDEIFDLAKLNIHPQ